MEACCLCSCTTFLAAGVVYMLYPFKRTRSKRSFCFVQLPVLCTKQRRRSCSNLAVPLDSTRVYLPPVKFQHATEALCCACFQVASPHCPDRCHVSDGSGLHLPYSHPGQKPICGGGQCAGPTGACLGTCSVRLHGNDTAQVPSRSCLDMRR